MSETTTRLRCAHCRRKFTPTKKRKLTCGAVECRVKRADKTWNRWSSDRSCWQGKAHLWER